MKYLDRVKILTNNYEKFGILKNDEGHILSAAIRNGTFDFYREDPATFADDKNAAVKIEDLEVTRSSNITDDDIKEDLPKHDPHWWCKVENGFILNLLGEKKNKIPYDYDS